MYNSSARLGTSPKSETYAELGRSIRNPKFIEPVDYLDILLLEQSPRLILTDTGGLQKEAHFLGVPCVTLRVETEWVETLESDCNLLVGTEQERILAGLKHSFPSVDRHSALFGGGHFAPAIVHILGEEYYFLC